MTTTELAHEMQDHANEFRFAANHCNPGATCPEADALDHAAQLLLARARAMGIC